jgi:hypothetical protein
VTIDELERALRSLPPADRKELLARLTVRKTLTEKILDGVNEQDLLLELAYLQRAIEIRRKREIKSRSWESQREHIDACFRRPIIAKRSKVDGVKCETEGRLKVRLEAVWQECPEIVRNIRRAVRKKRGEKLDREIDGIFDAAYHQLDHRAERVNKVLEYLDEVVNSDKPPPRKSAAWVNSYIVWRTGQPIATVKQYLSTLRRNKVQG